MLASVLVIGLCDRASWAQTDVDFINPYDELESSIWCLSDEERQQLSALYGEAEQASWRKSDAQDKYEQAQREYDKAAQKAYETSEPLTSSPTEQKAKAAAATAAKIARSKWSDAWNIRREADLAYNKALQAYRAALAAAKAKAKTCPRPVTPAESFYFFIQTLKNSGQLELAERLAEAGQQTFGSKDKVDPLGVGIGVGYNFAPWNNSVLLGVFASFDWLDQTINHNFPAGTFIGTQSHWIATGGVKFGVATAHGAFIYGLAGVGALNQDRNINFGGPLVTSSNTTVPGVTLGLGGEYAPSFLQRFGRPVSLFAQYQHTWWQDAHLDRPTASPLFNYAFRREDDTVKFGVNIYFGTPTPAEPARPMVVKAPRLK
jgi:opacity protein-like surface antigen